MTEPIWKVGEELEERKLPPLTRLGLIEYAGASGDYNPIHTVDEAAQRAGLPGVIAHGMFTAATMGALFSPYLEHGYVKDLRIRFFAPRLLGEELCVGARITGVEEETLYSFEVYARRGEDTVASGTAGFLAYEERAAREKNP